MSVLKPEELLHVQVAWRDLAVNKAVGVFLLGTVQLLTVLIDMFQDPTTVGRRQLEPDLWFRDQRDMFSLYATENMHRRFKYISYSQKRNLTGSGTAKCLYCCYYYDYSLQFKKQLFFFYLKLLK